MCAATTAGDPPDKSESQIADRLIMNEAAREFRVELEKRMLGGYSSESNRHWALTEMGCPAELFDKIRAHILHTWSTEGRTLRGIGELRDEARARYNGIFQRAMEKGQYKNALGALDSICRLDGLDRPIEMEITHTLGGAITNDARSRVAELIEKARSIVAGKTMKILEGGAASPVIDAESTEILPRNGHSNGHR